MENGRRGLYWIQLVTVGATWVLIFYRESEIYRSNFAVEMKGEAEDGKGRGGNARLGEELAKGHLRSGLGYHKSTLLAYLPSL